MLVKFSIEYNLYTLPYILLSTYQKNILLSNNIAKLFFFFLFLSIAKHDLIEKLDLSFSNVTDTIRFEL